MKKAVFLILFFTCISKVVGFFRDIILSYVYGANSISDAYLIALTIPGVIFAFIGIGIATSFIPMYNDVEKSKGVNRANLFTNNLINILLLFCTILIVLGWVFTYPLVRMFAAGFDASTMNLAVTFTRISMVGIYLTVLIHLLSSYLNLKENYHIPVIAGIPFNLIVAISIILSKYINILLLPIGIIIGLLFQLMIIIFSVYRTNFRYGIYFNIKDNNINKLIRLSLPVILGVSVNQINALVDRTIASTVVVGGISALNYANRLNTFIQDIFVMSITTAMYPLISKMVVNNDISGLKKTLSSAITGINLFVIPATIGSMLFASPVINLLFGRGEFDPQASVLTASALFFYSIGMVGFGLREVLSRAFYSMQDTKTPMINAAIGMLLNIILNIILSRYMGIGGLALATSIAAIFTTILLFISLRKKIGPFGIKQMSTSFLKILFVSLIMGLFAKFIFNYLSYFINQNLSLLLAIGVGAILYFAIIYFMKIDDVDVIIRAIRGKFRRATV